MAPLLDERARRLWAAAESAAIGYGGDALVSAATGLARETIRNGRRELVQGVESTGRIRRPGAGRPDIEETQPGVTEALDLLAAVRERLTEAGTRIVQTPYQAPNANAYAERFVRSIKEECLNREPITRGLRTN